MLTGRRNRQAIAAREMRVAERLRAVERAYRLAIERDVMVSQPDPTTLMPRSFTGHRSNEGSQNHEAKKASI